MAPRSCSCCGTAIPSDRDDGLCPVCLLGLAAQETRDTATVRSDAEPELQPGQVFDRYQLLRLLGRGGMGVVYQALHLPLGRPVALKLIRSGCLASEAEVRRFRTEAMATSRLQHPNIVAVHDVGESDGRHFFTMDYVEGVSLDALVREQPLSPARAAHYVETVAGAVDHAHQRGILHRDLKPANILIDPDDQPRLTDFGLAKWIGPGADATLSGGVVGTPSYMSPEQASGHHHDLGPATDVYALGAILYDLVTGRPPFRADSPIETLHQVIDTDPVRPCLLNPALPRDLETICLKALAKVPAHRYRSAADLAADLRRFQRGEPVLARRIGRIGRALRWARRNRIRATVLAASGVVVLGLTIAAWQDRRDALNTSEHAAMLAALGLGYEIAALKNLVADAAREPRLVGTLVEPRPNRARLTNFLAEFLVVRSTPRTAFENWALMDAEGNTLARFPPPREPPLVNRRGRDYFDTPLARAARGDHRPYVSKIYRSLEDHLDKLGISCVVTNPEGRVLGVLAGMVGTGSPKPDPTGATPRGHLLGIASAAARITVVGEGDTRAPLERPGADPAAPEFAVLLHHDLQRRVEIRHPLLNQLIRSPDVMPPPHASRLWHLDPLRTHDWRYHGVWVAAFARVPDCPLIVIYQNRNRVFDALVVSSLLTLGTVLVTALADRARRRRRETGRPTLPLPPDPEAAR